MMERTGTHLLVIDVVPNVVVQLRWVDHERRAGLKRRVAIASVVSAITETEICVLSQVETVQKTALTCE
jgi:hypothetical protein